MGLFFYQLMSLFLQEGGTPNTLYFDHHQFQTSDKIKWQAMNGTHHQEFYTSKKVHNLNFQVHMLSALHL